MAEKYDFIIIDGNQYNIGVYAGIKETADFLDNYANRTEDGDLKRDLIGVYFNFTDIKFEPQTERNYDEFERLWNKLTEPEEFHTVKIANFEFKAYFNNVSRVINDFRGGKAYKKDMTVNFTAKKPARS
jgi:hypothetical protein|uniref:Uncharacterized protein n=1 Tax=Myoviridae sp. ctKPn8 TaxID=2827676 RepID=A0A8S5SXT7_9CAUD|nr:MAG TPA: hypothetical protein [Myoviridae sp. ctKPn8]